MDNAPALAGSRSHLREGHLDFEKYVDSPARIPEHSLIDLIRESVIVVRLDGRVSQWNRAADALYGWSRVQVIGRLLRDLFDESTCPSFAVDGFKAWEGEVQRRTSQGVFVKVHIRRSLRLSSVKTPIDFIETGLVLDFASLGGGSRDQMPDRELCIRSA